jgi:hypothetical protein
MKRILFVLTLGLVVALAGPRASAGIKVYVDKDYKGDSIEIDAAIPDLRKLDFDDRISSLQADERWLVCSAPRFKGDCREVEGGVVNLRQEGLNDRITSLKPMKQKGSKRAKEREEGERSELDAPVVHLASASAEEWWGGSTEGTAFRATSTGGRPHIQVFEERDYSGRWSRFHGPVADLERRDAPGVIRSVILENGPWEICSRPAFEGDCRILRDSTEDLDEWSDRIASLRPAS